MSLRRVPALLGLAVLLGHVALLYRAAVSHTDGSFCYPLDDAFIHMAIARNVAQHGVFGVSPHVFASASSSVLWPLLLATVDRIIGDHLLTPLALNALFGCALVFFFCRWIERDAPKATVLQRSLLVVAMVALAPLPTLVVIGMEHTLHALVAMAFVAAAARCILEKERPVWPLLILAALATGLRYESLFLTGAVAALLVFRRRYKHAAVLLAAAAVPIVAFGLYSVAHGELFLPTSVLLKGTKVRIDDISDVGDLLGGNFFSRVAAEPHMLAAPLLAAFVLVLAIKKNGLFSPHAVRLAIVEIASLAHIELASLNWFFRYEAYLVVLLVGTIGIFVLDEGPSLANWLLARWGGIAATLASALVVVLGVGPLVRRAIQAAQYTPSACRNIYDQQVQNARFLKRYFGNEPVAINDIGAVAYLGGMPIVDLAGLATLPIARAKHFEMSRAPLATAVAAATSDTRVAIVYDEWVPYHPHAWTLIGRWRIAGCRSCFSPVVNIYATRPEAIPDVTAALRDFGRELPEDVGQEGIYTDTRAHADPGAPDFLLSSGDVVRIHLPGSKEDDPVESVDDDGRVGLPFVKLPILARGRSLPELADVIDRTYASSHPRELSLTGHAVVTLLEKRWLRYARAGNVLRPGAFWTPDATSIGQIVASSGVASQTSHQAPYVFRRNADERYVKTPVSLEEPVEPLDIVVVP